MALFIRTVNILIAVENTIRLSAGFLIASADSLILSASILIAFSTVIKGLKILRKIPRNAQFFPAMEIMRFQQRRDVHRQTAY